MPKSYRFTYEISWMKHIEYWFISILTTFLFPQYHHVPYLKIWRYDERNTHLCINFNLVFSLRCLVKVKIYFILIYVILLNISHEHYIIIFDTNQSYSNVLHTTKEILIYAIINLILVMYIYPTSTCTRPKNIFHCLMYIIFLNIAHVHYIITEAYNSQYHRTLCLEHFRYDERNTHLSK